MPWELACHRTNHRLSLNRPGPVAQLDACPTGSQEVAGLRLRSGTISFIEVDHEIISTFIISIPLIQEGQ